MPRGETWTTSQLKLAKEMEAAGATRKQIGEALGRSRSGVRYALRVIGTRPLKERKSNDEPPIVKAKEIRIQSDKLSAAINELLAKLPENVVRDILCPPTRPEPGTERPFVPQTSFSLAA